MEGMSFADYERKIAELEATVERLSFNSYAHMCRDEHVQIGHNDSSSEMCPLCRMKAENQKMAELLDQAPHEAMCVSLGFDNGLCDCWKKEANALISS